MPSPETFTNPLNGFINENANCSFIWPPEGFSWSWKLFADTPEYTEMGSANFPGSPIYNLMNLAETFIWPLLMISKNPLVKMPGLNLLSAARLSTAAAWALQCHSCVKQIITHAAT